MGYDGGRRRALLVALEREGDEGRAAAAAELCQMAATAPAQAVELAADIPRLLSDKSAPVRRCGLALAATVLSPEEAFELLQRHSRDASEEVRTEAVGRIADLTLPEGRPALAASLADPVFAVRFEAARGISALRHAAGLDVLVEGLRKDDYRFRALGALGELGDARAVDPVRAVFKKWLLPPFERTQAAGVLAKLGDAAGAAHLFKVAHGRWSTDRAMAIELLGEVRVPAAFETLERVVNDAKDACRGAAARGLGRLGDGRALAPLVSLLHDPAAPEDFRLDAAEGLCRLGSAEARQEAQRASSAFGPEARSELEAMLAETAP
jgi:HEAT repeat protein